MYHVRNIHEWENDDGTTSKCEHKNLTVPNG